MLETSHKSYKDLVVIKFVESNTLTKILILCHTYGVSNYIQLLRLMKYQDD